MSRLRIALHGYARTGKDTVVGRLLTEHYGLPRVAMGDLIKAQCDSITRSRLGISAFTIDPAAKERIRPLLVAWGDVFNGEILDAFCAGLPERCVSTRILRLEECQRWVDAGGQVWEVARPGFGPAEPREAEELRKCHKAGLISHTIVNYAGDAEALDQIRHILGDKA